MRICRSRAAHPRVNEPAVVPLIMAPRHKAAMATWTEQFRKCFVMIDLPERFARLSTLRCRAASSGLTGEFGKAASLRAGRFCLCHDELLAAIRVPMQLEAHVGVRIGADIGAALPCVVTGRDALLLRCGQCARSGSEHESQCEGGLGEHGDCLRLCSSLTPFLVCVRIMLARGVEGKSARRIADESAER